MTSFFILTIVVFEILNARLTFKLMVEDDSGQVKNVTKSCSYLMSILITSDKLGMIYTLAYRPFNICSDSTEFHEKFNLLKLVFLKNGYPFSFIDKCFKTIINKLVIKRPQITTVEKKTLILSLPYLGDKNYIKEIFQRCFELL